MNPRSRRRRPPTAPATGGPFGADRPPGLLEVAARDAVAGLIGGPGDNVTVILSRALAQIAEVLDATQAVVVQQSPTGQVRAETYWVRRHTIALTADQVEELVQDEAFRPAGGRSTAQFADTAPDGPLTRFGVWATVQVASSRAATLLVFLSDRPVRDQSMWEAATVALRDLAEVTHLRLHAAAPVGIGDWAAETFEAHVASGSWTESVGALLDRCLDATGASSGYVLQHGPSGIRASRSGATLTARKLPPPPAVTELWIASAAAKRPGLHRWLQEHDAAAAIVTPIRGGYGQRGALYLVFTHPPAIGPSGINGTALSSMVEAFALLIGTAGVAADSRTMVETVLDTQRAVSSHVAHVAASELRDLPKVAVAAITDIGSRLGATRAEIHIDPTIDGQLGHPLGDEATEHPELTETLIGLVADSRVFWADLSDPGLSDEMHGILVTLGVTSLITVPTRRRNGAIGALLTLGFPGPLPASVDVLSQVLEPIADTLSVSAARARAERAQRLTTRRWEVLAQHATDMFWILDDVGAVQYASPSAMSFRAATSEVGADGLATPTRGITDVRDRFAAFVARPDDEPSTVFSSVDVVADDGSRRHLETIVTDLRDDPAVGGILVVARDVTELVEMNVALAASEQIYRSLFDNHPSAVFHIDASATVVGANAAARTSFGDLADRTDAGSLGEMIGDPVAAPKISELIVAALAGEGPGLVIATPETADGKMLYYRVVVVPTHRELDETGVFVIIRDDTDVFDLSATVRAQNAELRDVIDRLERTRSALADSAETERRLIAAHLHDGPTQTVVSAGWELDAAIAQGGAGVEELEAIKTLVRDAAGQLRNEALALLSWGLESGGIGAAIADFLNQRSASTSCELRLASNVTPGTRFCDHVEVMVFRTTQELVQNCIKHVRHGRVDVRIALDRTHGFLQVEVEDDGPGFTFDPANPPPGHFGLVSIAEAVAREAGTLEIIRTDRGGLVRFTVPAQPLPRTDSADD